MLFYYFIISTLFIFLLTSLGAMLVLFFKNDIDSKKSDLFLSFAGGIMLSASIFSLLIPSLESEGKYSEYNLLLGVIGIILGALFILIFDAILINKNKDDKNNKYKKLFLAMTIHNFPEGLAVGLSFGVALTINQELNYLAPLMLALGIGIQNFPEGASTSFAMCNLIKSKKKAALLGIISGIIEPFASLLGFVFAIYLQDLLPLILAIGCGSMLFVVIDEVFVNKESINDLKKNIIFLFGFLLMMILDVLLG